VGNATSNGRRQTATSEAKPATVEAPTLVEAVEAVEAKPATVEAPAAFVSAPAIAPASAPAKLSDQTISELKRIQRASEIREAEIKESRRLASRLKSDIRTRPMQVRDMSAHTVWFYRNPRTLKDIRFKRELHSSEINGTIVYTVRSANDVQQVSTADDLSYWFVEVMQM